LGEPGFEWRRPSAVSPACLERLVEGGVESQAKEIVERGRRRSALSPRSNDRIMDDRRRRDRVVEHHGREPVGLRQVAAEEVVEVVRLDRRDGSADARLDALSEHFGLSAPCCSRSDAPDHGSGRNS